MIACKIEIQKSKFGNELILWICPFKTSQENEFCVSFHPVSYIHTIVLPNKLWL